jgi:LacI family transcriptional regulator
MITIKMIAKHFNISAAAVSKTLNGIPAVSEELRQEILKFAKENNYIPNIYGRGLKGEKMGVFGVILADNTNMIHSKLIKGIEREADKHGYNIILCNSSEDWKKEQKQINMLLQKRIDGLLIVPAPPNREETEKRYTILDNIKIPYVCVYRSLSGCNCDIVKSDNVSGALLATQFLIGRGHKKILHSTTNKNISSGQERLKGYRMALKKAGISYKEENVIFVDETDREEIKRRVIETIQEQYDYTAIFAFNDNIAFAAMLALRSAGKRIPQDMAIIGFDNTDMADISIVPLTTVSQDGITLGRMAVEVLLERIQNKEKNLKTLILPPGGIVERESV